MLEQFTQLARELPDNPMRLAKNWLDEASAAKAVRNANAMTLATVSGDGQPSARVVLCKQFVADRGFVVFYTNYHSRKCQEILQNPRVAVVFHWDWLGRQVRIEGEALLSPAPESDAYFRSRDRGSQLGAWGSDQSEPIASHAALLEQIRERAARLGLRLDPELRPDDSQNLAIERPPHWGGIRVWASAVELWVEGASRIHDRARWQRQLQRESEFDCRPSAWIGTRLQP